MKKIVPLLVIFVLASCSSQKKLETKDIPFEIGPSSVQQWAAGREEGGSGVQLTIAITGFQKEVTFDAIYFRGRALRCDFIEEDDHGTLTTSYRTDEEDILDPVGKKMKATFKLGPNEAVIVFSDGMGAVKYAKVSNIKQKSAVLYKGRLKN